ILGLAAQQWAAAHRLRTTGLLVESQGSVEAEPRARAVVAAAPTTTLTLKQQARMRRNRTAAQMRLLMRFVDQFAKPYFTVLMVFVVPGPNEIKVVILGEETSSSVFDHGLAFSFQKGILSSLCMFTELEISFPGFPRDFNGDFMKWAEKRVLLLNEVLTVWKYELCSKPGKGWEQFTDTDISCLKRELLVESGLGQFVKPCFMELMATFICYWHFTMANEILQSSGKKPIQWAGL
uniref:Uncharacterized protein n=1 Tax=Anolis carolinensis TaxID=28377 RepID=A0A803TWY4_ANOCA